MAPLTPLRVGDDHLSTLIPELLIEVLSHVPSSDYLFLVHTSQSLRHFLRANCSQICNKAIRNVQHALSINPKLFPTTLTQGWLVPTGSSFVEAEDYIYQRILAPPPRSRRYHFETKSSIETSASGQTSLNLSSVKALVKTTSPRLKSFEMKIKLSNPGPQYLHFLERHGRMLQAQYTTRISMWEHFGGHPAALVQTEQDIHMSWKGVLERNYIQPFLKSANSIPRDTEEYAWLTGVPRVGSGLIWYYSCA